MVVELSSFFKGMLSTFSLFSAVPAIVTFFISYFYPKYNQLYVFTITLLIIWILYTELRLRDIKRKLPVKRRKKK